MMKIKLWKLGIVIWSCSCLTKAHAVADICDEKQAISPDAPDAHVISVICSDVTGYLYELDQTLNGYYRAAMERSRDRKRLVQDQRKWLKQRNACDERPCVAEAYHRRIQDLSAEPAKAAIHSFKSGALYGGVGLLTREMGLKNFDGGKSDYDIVDSEQGDRNDSTKPCRDRYIFLGTGISVFTPCLGPEYGFFKPLESFDGRKFQLLIPYEIDNGIVGKCANMKDSVHDDRFIGSIRGGAILADEYSTYSCKSNFPFDYPLARVEDGKTIWKHYIVRRIPPSGESKEITFSDYPLLPNIQLADGSILMVGQGWGYRLDTDTGRPYDTVNFRVISYEQGNKWSQEWLDGYLSKTPECSGNIEECPDQKAAAEYLWKRFSDEMKHQFATAD